MGGPLRNFVLQILCFSSANKIYPKPFKGIFTENFCDQPAQSASYFKKISRYGLKNLTLRREK